MAELRSIDHLRDNMAGQMAGGHRPIPLVMQYASGDYRIVCFYCVRPIESAAYGWRHGRALARAA